MNYQPLLPAAQKQTQKQKQKTCCRRCLARPVPESGRTLPQQGPDQT
jgi:hypothetical protein